MVKASLLEMTLWKVWRVGREMRLDWFLIQKSQMPSNVLLMTTGRWPKDKQIYLRDTPYKLGAR